MVRQPGRQPTDDERRQAYEAVRAAVAGIVAFPPGALETAQFLLDEAKAAFERTTARTDRFESKATTLLGLVAGGSGALGVFALSRGGATISRSPFILAALVFVMISFLSVLYILRSKGLAEVDVAAYVSTEMATRDNRISLALLLAAEYGEMDDRLRLEARNEPRALLVAYAATAVAAVLIVLDVFLVQSAPATTRTTLSAALSGHFNTRTHLPSQHPTGSRRP
jgi:hypothetical protein